MQITEGLPGNRQYICERRDDATAYSADGRAKGLPGEVSPDSLAPVGNQAPSRGPCSQWVNRAMHGIVLPRKNVV